MPRLELHTTLDHPQLDAILELIEEATRHDGHRPLDEQKYAHLDSGATGWTGVLAYRGGQLVGYAHHRWNPQGQEPRVAAELVVHPAHREDDVVARALLSETHEVVAHRGGGTMWLWAHRVSDPRSTLAHRLGFAVHRELAFMTKALEDPPQRGRPPEGVMVRAYRPGPDDPELLRVNNAAFEGHPENGGWEQAELEARRSLAWFEPEGVITAWRGDRLLGFHWTKWHGRDSGEADAGVAVGEVYVLGVDPAAQGEGLGRLLLVEGLAHLHERGARLAVLYVDRADEAAVRLYETEGFEVTHSEVCYERDVPTALSSSP